MALFAYYLHFSEIKSVSETSSNNFLEPLFKTAVFLIELVLELDYS